MSEYGGKYADASSNMQERRSVYWYACFAADEFDKRNSESKRKP